MTSIDQFFRRVSHVARGCPTAVLTDAVLQAAEDFCERTWLWLEDLPPIQTVDGQTAYTVAAPTYAAILAIKSLTIDGSTAPFTSSTRNRVTLVSDPGPDKALVAEAALKPSRTAKVLPDFLYVEWQDAIAAGARFKLLDMHGAEWHQPQLADKYRLEFERLWVPRARVEGAHRQGRPLSVRKRRFI